MGLKPNEAMKQLPLLRRQNNIYKSNRQNVIYKS